jgi:hypothetical protein
MRTPRPTFSSTIAVLALFVALGGSSYAAIQISGTSIKNGTVTGTDLKNETVKSADIDNRTLLAKDFKPGQLPAGPAGPVGAQGPQGDPGPQGPAGPTSVVVRRIDVPIPAVEPPVAPRDPEVTPAVARCNPGERAVGGGAGIERGTRGAGVLSDEPAVENGPAGDGDTPTGWLAIGINTTPEEALMRVHAVCVAP